MLHDVIYEIKCTEAEAAAYKAGLFKVMRRIYQGDGATEAKSSTSASIKSPNSDLEVAKELQGRAHRSRSDSPVIITSGPSTRKKSPVVTLIEDDPVPAAVKSPTPPPKRKHVPHPSTQKPQYKDGDEVASGYCMYSVTFPKPKWSKDQSTRNRETEAFKNGLYDQLIYVVKNEEIHAAFIEFSDGQPSAVVIQDSTVFGLKSAYVQIYRIINEMVDIEWYEAAFRDDLVDDVGVITLLSMEAREKYMQDGLHDYLTIVGDLHQRALRKGEKPPPIRRITGQPLPKSASSPDIKRRRSPSPASSLYKQPRAWATASPRQDRRRSSYR